MIGNSNGTNQLAQEFELKPFFWLNFATSSSSAASSSTSSAIANNFNTSLSSLHANTTTSSSNIPASPARSILKTNAVSSSTTSSYAYRKELFAPILQEVDKSKLQFYESQLQELQHDLLDDNDRGSNPNMERMESFDESNHTIANITHNYRERLLTLWKDAINLLQTSFTHHEKAIECYNANKKDACIVWIKAYEMADQAAAYKAQLATYVSECNAMDFDDILNNLSTNNNTSKSHGSMVSNATTTASGSASMNTRGTMSLFEEEMPFSIESEGWNTANTAAAGGVGAGTSVATGNGSNSTSQGSDNHHLDIMDSEIHEKRTMYRLMEKAADAAERAMKCAVATIQHLHIEDKLHLQHAYDYLDTMLQVAQYHAKASDVYEQFSDVKLSECYHKISNLSEQLMFYKIHSSEVMKSWKKDYVVLYAEVIRQTEYALSYWKQAVEHRELSFQKQQQNPSIRESIWKKLTTTKEKFTTWQDLISSRCMEAGNAAEDALHMWLQAIEASCKDIVLVNTHQQVPQSPLETVLEGNHEQDDTSPEHTRSSSRVALGSSPSTATAANPVLLSTSPSSFSVSAVATAATAWIASPTRSTTSTAISPTRSRSASNALGNSITNVFTHNAVTQHYIQKAKRIDDRIATYYQLAIQATTSDNEALARYYMGACKTAKLEAYYKAKVSEAQLFELPILLQYWKDCVDQVEITIGYREKAIEMLQKKKLQSAFLWYDAANASDTVTFYRSQLALFVEKLFFVQNPYYRSLDRIVLLKHRRPYEIAILIQNSSTASATAASSSISSTVTGTTTIPPHAIVVNSHVQNMLTSFILPKVWHQVIIAAQNTTGYHIQLIASQKQKDSKLFDLIKPITRLAESIAQFKFAYLQCTNGYDIVLPRDSIGHHWLNIAQKTEEAIQFYQLANESYMQSKHALSQLYLEAARLEESTIRQTSMSIEAIQHGQHELGKRWQEVANSSEEAVKLINSSIHEASTNEIAQEFVNAAFCFEESSLLKSRCIQATEAQQFDLALRFHDASITTENIGNLKIHLAELKRIGNNDEEIKKYISFIQRLDEARKYRYKAVDYTKRYEDLLAINRKLAAGGGGSGTGEKDRTKAKEYIEKARILETNVMNVAFDNM